MISDTEIRIKGFRALLDSLGEIGAERFIALAQREPFDYTIWQQSLWNDKTVAEISAMAMRLRKEKDAEEKKP